MTLPIRNTEYEIRNAPQNDPPYLQNGAIRIHNTKLDPKWIFRIDRNTEYGILLKIRMSLNTNRKPYSPGVARSGVARGASARLSDSSLACRELEPRIVPFCADRHVRGVVVGEVVVAPTHASLPIHRVYIGLFRAASPTAGRGRFRRSEAPKNGI